MIIKKKQFLFPSTHFARKKENLTFPPIFFPPPSLLSNTIAKYLHLWWETIDRKVSCMRPCLHRVLHTRGSKKGRQITYRSLPAGEAWLYANSQCGDVAAPLLSSTDVSVIGFVWNFSNSISECVWNRVRFLNGGEERKRGGGGVSSRQSSKEDLCVRSKFFDARSVVEDCLLLGIIFREEEVEINSISYILTCTKGGG